MLPGAPPSTALRASSLQVSTGPRFFDAQLAQLPRLQRMVCSTFEPCPLGACLWLSRPQPPMGSLSSTLLHPACGT